MLLSCTLNLNIYSTTDISVLKDRLDNWNTTTEIGDVQGLDDIISNLKTNYQTNQTDQRRADKKCDMHMSPSG